MGKKSRLLDYKKSKKANKRITGDRVPSSEEQHYLSKGNVVADTGYFTQDFSPNRFDLGEGNTRKERRNSMVIRTKQYIQLTEDSGFSLHTTIKPTKGPIMSTCSTPNGGGMISSEPSSIGFTKEITAISDHTDCDKPSQDSFKVFLRIRPLEDLPDSTSTRLRSLSVENNTQVMLCTRPSKGKESNGTKYLFTYSYVLAEGTPQREVFEVTTQSLVDAALAGNHTCVISYGIPNSGKSYTLYGKATSGKHRGVIMRAMENLFSTVNGNKDAKVQYKVSTSFLQIYNEKFYDLLDPSASDGIKFAENGATALLEGVTQTVVTTVDEVSKQLRRSPNRMRDAGSRSHTVYTVKLVKEEILQSSHEKSTAMSERLKVTEGELRFVDLVGVERSVKHASYDSPAVSTAEAKTAKSLQLFASMVTSFADDKSLGTSHRDSKLTRLLRSAIGGDCITRLIVTATPDPNLAHETLSSLQFGQKACQIMNHPTPKVTVEERNKDQPVENDGNNPDKALPRKFGTTQNYKLPPIHSNSSHQINFDDILSDSLDHVPMGQRSNENIYSEVAGLTELSAANTSTTSGIFSEERDRISPDGIILVQSKPENENKVFALPHLKASGTGQIFAHRSAYNEKAFERVPEKKSPNSDNARRSVRRRSTSSPIKSDKHAATPRASSQESILDITNHKDILRSSDRADFLHGSHEAIGLRKTPSPCSTIRTEYAFESPKPPSTAVDEDRRTCCAECKVREEKIKADYDRMILFSKKDRDDKKTKIDDLQREIKRLKTESVSLSQIKLLEEQRAQDKMTTEQQAKEITRLEAAIETLKVKLGGMVSSTELAAVQEMRRKEHLITENLRHEIDTLKLRIREDTEKYKKDMMAKNDAIRRIERECNALKKDTLEKDKAINDSKKRHEERMATTSVEIQRAQSRNESIISELNSKLLACSIEMSRMRDLEIKSTKEHQEEKENLTRELVHAKSAVSQTQAELKIAQGKLVSMERGQKIAKPGSQKVSLSQLSSRTSLRQSMDLKDAGTAMSNSPVSDVPTNGENGGCESCGRQLGRLELTPDIERDEELRILLLQDARNREVLIQLKRERNLLCDVMKIMYCRQWFIDEALPHVKRTLRRVGVDTKSLNTLRKKF